MLRINKLTDYGILLLARFAQEPAGATLSARALAASAHLPLPVVSKMLKTLAGVGLLRSVRGAKGGYQLACEPRALSVAALLELLEGPVALMECAAGPGHCEQEQRCTLREPWQRINAAVRSALSKVTLAELLPSPTRASGVELLNISRTHGVRGG